MILNGIRWKLTKTSVVFMRRVGHVFTIWIIYRNTFNQPEERGMKLVVLSLSVPVPLEESVAGCGV